MEVAADGLFYLFCEKENDAFALPMRPSARNL
jgi:hypothetical protein